MGSIPSRVLRAATVVLGLLAVVALRAQWLETTIQFPDASTPTALCYNSENNKIYCALWGQDSVAVIDGGTNEVRRKLALGPGPSRMFYNPASNKVYCCIAGKHPNWQPFVAIIDAASDSTLTVLRVDTLPAAFAYSPVHNKVYCGSKYGRNIAIIDGSTDSVVARIRAGYENLSACYDSVHDRVYFAGFGSDQVAVIDCDTDSLVKMIDLRPDSYPYDILWNPSTNTVYVGCFSTNTVVVIDCGSNTILRRVPVGRGPNRFCYNPIDCKVYSAEDSVTVFDARTHYVLREVWVGAYAVDMLHSTATDLVYCSVYDTVDSVIAVLDGRTDEVSKVIYVGANPGRMTYNSTNSRIYVSCSAGNSLAVIRDSLTLAVDDEEGLQGTPHHPTPTIIRGEWGLWRPFDPTIRPSLVSTTGRMLSDMRPGPGDIGRLTSGIYFLLAQTEQGQQTVSKIVVAR